MKQLFQIGSDTWNGLTVEEVNATWDDMVTMGIDQPPFKEFDVAISAKFFISLLRKFSDNKETWHGLFDRGPDAAAILVFNLAFNPSYRELIFTDNETSHHLIFTRGHIKEGLEASTYVYRSFLVLLATRNVIREVKENKLAKRGIGKSPYVKTTTLKLGTVVETVGESTGEGSVLRPHLRRGHVRNQRYGPGLGFSRKVFIQPVFVNADQGWVAERTAYNVTA
jgi:hypothetical protein